MSENREVIEKSVTDLEIYFLELYLEKVKNDIEFLEKEIEKINGVLKVGRVTIDKVSEEGRRNGLRGWVSILNFRKENLRDEIIQKLKDR